MDKKEYKCEKCDSILTTKWNLDRHQKNSICLKKMEEKLQITKIVSNIKPILTAPENKGDIIFPVTNGNSNNITSTINKNNITNILKFSPDFSKENIKKIVKLINEETILNKNGLSEFFEKYIARNKDGECGIISINKSSDTFFFLDEKKEIHQKSAKFITKYFDIYAEDEINSRLKRVKEIVVSLIDYGEILKNIRNKEKLKKDIRYLMCITNPDFQIVKIEDVIEKEDHPDLIELKKEQKKLRIERNQFETGTFDKNTIEIDDEDIDNKLVMKNVDGKKNYKATTERNMKIWINKKRIDNVCSTPDIERKKYIELVRTQEMNNRKINNRYKIREVNKKIRDFNFKWYMEKRMNMELKEEIKQDKKEKKKEKDFDEEVEKLNKKEMYELKDEEDENEEDEDD